MGYEFDLSLEKIEQLAEQGDLFFQVEVGNIYARIRDYENAYHWYHLAALQGHGGAQSMVGYCLYEGYGVHSNWEEAVIWLEKAVSQGFYTNASILYACYYYGQGTKKDEKKAAELAELLENGGPEEINPADLPEKYKTMVNRKLPYPYEWYKKAADKGDYRAQKMLRIYPEKNNKGDK